ncbi:hypothetical protein HWV62_24035 [Athelia sp. TMB]|nr:hypothetical protein HWV62_24035 [Athelia sp. TMB]
MSSTTAELTYFVPPADGSPAFINAFADEATGKRATNSTEARHQVEIENLRGKENSVSLDTAGFQLVKRAATHTKFTNKEEIEKEYYPECVDLIKELTGAGKAVPCTTAIRKHRPNQPDTPESRQPVSDVHADQTTSSAINRVHEHMLPGEAEALLKRRFQIINLWRPISHAALDWPLALCDSRSVDAAKDLHPVTMICPDRTGDVVGVTYSPEHKWKYFRGMQPDEVVAFKCFDSVQDGSVAVLTLHTGFEDPSTPENAPLRESIELRALVFYD